jgi:hypothetical protein
MPKFEMLGESTVVLPLTVEFVSVIVAWFRMALPFPFIATPVAVTDPDGEFMPMPLLLLILEPVNSVVPSLYIPPLVPLLSETDELYSFKLPKRFVIPPAPKTLLGESEPLLPVTVESISVTVPLKL